MRNLIPITILALVALAFAPSSVLAAEKVVWGGADNPPFHIFEGPHADTGYSDLTRIYYANRLPEFEHETVKLTLTRLFDIARNGGNICYCNLLKTPEREEIFYFSKVVALSPGPHLYVRIDSPIQSMAKDGAVSLEAVLSARKYKRVAEKGRAFGPGIQTLLETYSSPVNMALTSDIEHKYELLCAGRVDFFIEYPYVLERYLNHTGLDRCLTALRISEAAPYIPAYIACSKTELGARVIDRVNAVLQGGKGTQEQRAVFMAPARDLSEQGRREHEELYEIFKSLD